MPIQRPIDANLPLSDASCHPVIKTAQHGLVRALTRPKHASNIRPTKEHPFSPSEGTEIMGPKFTRRQALAGSAAAAAGLVTGCSNPYLGGHTSETKGELKILWNNWGQIADKAMTKIGTAYEKSHTGTKINWNFNQDWQSKLLTQVNGNVAPSITYTNWQTLPELSTSKTFKPLDDYLKSAGLGPSDFIGNIYDQCVTDGHLMALPGGADFLTLFWSKDLYREAGLDPEKPPTTADELIQHSLHILKIDKRGNIARMGYIPSADDYIQWAFIFGGGFYDANSKTVTADRQENVDALTWLMQYLKRFDVNKLTAFSQSADYSQPGNAFASKKAAYLHQGFWAYDALDKYAPNLDYGVTYWPTKTGAVSERSAYLIQGWQAAIPRNAGNLDTAWEFMKYAFVDHSAKMGWETENGPCYSKQVGAFEAGLKNYLGADNRLTPYINVFSNTGRLGKQHWPNMPVCSYYYDQVSQAYDQVTRGKQTPAAALGQVQQRVEAKLKASK